MPVIFIRQFKFVGTLDSIIDRFEKDKAPGFHAIYNVSASELAERFGRRNGRHVYDRADLKIRWIRMWCQ